MASYADDLADAYVEDLYSFSWEMPGDGGEGGGRSLIRIESSDIFDQLEIYPHNNVVLKFIWSIGGLANRAYVESFRNTPKYSATNSIMLYNIYKYRVLDGSDYEAEDIFFYYVDKAVVANYLSGNRSDDFDGLMPFALDDLYAFEMSDGTVVYRSAIKRIYFKK